MRDTKLFQIQGEKVSKIVGSSVAIEKTLQTLLEHHLEEFLGVQFLASEYSTGPTHGGRIDTLGIDENKCPVIIEYKRALNENVINQGLFYLDWLLDHKAELKLLVQEKYGVAAAKEIDWPGARLLCIAADFTRYDEHAIKQINRNIELIRYRRYGEGLLLLELVNASAGEADSTSSTNSHVTHESTVSEKLEKASSEVKDRYESLKAYLLALGDDVQLQVQKNYFAYKRIKNFACVEIHPQTGEVLVFVKSDFTNFREELGFTRDVRKIGHFATGDLEITLSTDDDLERAKPFIEKSYEAN
jgi:Uncharacterized conserved protein